MSEQPVQSSGVAQRHVRFPTPITVAKVDNVVEINVLTNGKALAVTQDAWTESAQLLEIGQDALAEVLAKGVNEPWVSGAHTPKTRFQPVANAPFADVVHPSDASQGKVGNCRIISALQAVAVAQPGLLKAAISGGDGTFTITLRRNPPGPATSPKTTEPGISIVVDASLAIDCETSEIMYCQHGNSIKDSTFPIWPALLEKAFAQRWGGYHQLEGALEEPVMLALGLSVPIDSKINFMNGDRESAQQQKTWADKIKGFAAKGRPMTTAIDGKQHNYAIVKVEDEGIVISDPNTLRTGDYAERWAKPAKWSDGAGWKKADIWPLYLTWAQFCTTFRWVYSYAPPS